MAIGNVLARTPFGVLVQQNNKPALFLPPSAVPDLPDLLAPEPPAPPSSEPKPLTDEEKAALAATGGAVPGQAPPLPAGAFTPAEAAALASTGGAIPGGAPVPPAGPQSHLLDLPLGATQPGILDAPAAAAAPPPPIVETAAPLSEAAAGGPPPIAAPTPLVGASGGEAPPVEVAPPPSSPSPPPLGADLDAAPGEENLDDAQAFAKLQQGLLAKDKAEADAAVAARRDADLAKADGLAVEAAARIAARNEQLVKDYETAIKAKADWDQSQTKIARTEGHKGAGKIIAYALSALGSVLNRDGGKGFMSVIDMMDKRAQIEANARAEEGKRLGDAVSGQASLLGAVGKQAEGLTEKTRIQKAAILEGYAREFENVARKFGGEDALAKARDAALELRRRAKDEARKSANEQQELERKDSELTQRKIEQRQNLGLGYARIAEDKAQREMLDKRQRDLADADNKLRERDLVIKEADHQLKVDEVTGEKRMFGIPRVKMGDDGQPMKRADGKGYVFERSPLVNSDGKEWRPGTVDEAKEGRATIGGAMKATQLIDKAQNLIAKNGWSSDLVRSKEWQEVKSTFTEIQMARKGPNDLGLGVIAGPDMDLLNNILGGDPTGVRDPTPSLRTARANILIGVNTKLESLGYDGKAFEPSELTAGGDREAITDTEVSKLVKQTQDRAQGGVTSGESVITALPKEDQERARKANIGAGNLATEDIRAFPTKTVVAGLEGLARIASGKGDGEAKAQALLGLRSAAERQTSPIVRERARDIAEVYGVDVGNEADPDRKKRRVNEDVVSLGKSALQRGKGGTDAVTSGFKDLSPEDRQRVKAALYDPRKEDADPANFPTLEAMNAINKLAGIAGSDNHPWAKRADAARQLRELAKTAPTAMMRRRVKRIAAQWKVPIDSGAEDKE